MKRVANGDMSQKRIGLASVRNLTCVEWLKLVALLLSPFLLGMARQQEDILSGYKRDILAFMAGALKGDTDGQMSDSLSRLIRALTLFTLP